MEPNPSHPALARNKAVPDPQVTELTPHPWTRAIPAADGRSVRLEFTSAGPPCQQLGRAQVEEEASTVTVTLLVGPLPGADCSGRRAMIAAPFEIVVPLESPLAEREIRDGS
ncbi:hypothetical protein GCM10027456_09140 [Kineosporia babensis]